MELVSSTFGAKKASLSKTLLSGKDMLKVGKSKYVLSKDIEKVKISHEQNELTGTRMLLIIILALTVIGLLLAIPMCLAAKKKRVVMAFLANDGESFSIMTSNNKETKILSKYSAIGAFE